MWGGRRWITHKKCDSVGVKCFSQKWGKFYEDKKYHKNIWSVFKWGRITLRRIKQFPEGKRERIGEWGNIKIQIKNKVGRTKEN